MAKKKQIHVGWAMMRLNKAGNWQRFIIRWKRWQIIETYRNVWQTRDGHYETRLRAGTLKVKKMYVTM